MTETVLARSAPSPTPSVAGEGVPLPLAGGESRDLRFSARIIIKIENTFGSHEVFRAELDVLPLNTLAWILQVCCGTTLDEALDLLDGVNWRELVALVDIAWKRDNWIPDELPESPDPTPGS